MNIIKIRKLICSFHLEVIPASRFLSYLISFLETFWLWAVLAILRYQIQYEQDLRPHFYDAIANYPELMSKSECFRN